MTAAHYKGGHHPGNDRVLHYTALPPMVASCLYSDQLLVTRKFWSPGANRPSQANTGKNACPSLCASRSSAPAKVIAIAIASAVQGAAFTAWSTSSTGWRVKPRPVGR